jgi:hypothetical protein
MYDPMTVAHEIKWPWKNKHGYRDSIITIWHVDPEKNTLGCSADDSCGWFSPPYAEKEEKLIKKLAKDQYDQLFAKKVAYEEEKSYAYICYNQDCFGAIYWIWRAMKNLFNQKVAWQYGKYLSNKEFQYILQLATNPVDNFQWHIHQMMKPREEGFKAFEDFVFMIFRAFRGYYRPWYKHPRWHILHWKIQFHPWQKFKRRFLEKCSMCGRRGFTGSAYSDGGGKLWCEKCESAKHLPIPVDKSLGEIG